MIFKKVALPKLALFDVDGTLRNKSGVVSDAVRGALKKLRQAGCMIGLASGRPLFASRDLIGELEINAPSMLMSCALIVDEQCRVLHEVALTPESLKSLIQSARELALEIELATPTAQYIERITRLSQIHASYHPKPQELVSELHRLVEREPVLKASIVFEDEEGARRYRILKERMPEFRFSTAHGAGYPEITFANVVSSEAKADSGLEYIAKRLGIQVQEIAAFGDSESDIPVLEHVGFGVAMGNASSAVKASADFVTKSVEEDGVAYAIDCLLSGS